MVCHDTHLGTTARDGGIQAPFHGLFLKLRIDKTGAYSSKHVLVINIALPHPLEIDHERAFDLCRAAAGPPLGADGDKGKLVSVTGLDDLLDLFRVGRENNGPGRF